MRYCDVIFYQQMKYCDVIFHQQGTVLKILIFEGISFSYFKKT